MLWGEQPQAPYETPGSSVQSKALVPYFSSALLLERGGNVTAAPERFCHKAAPFRAVHSQAPGEDTWSQLQS